MDTQLNAKKKDAHRIKTPMKKNKQNSPSSCQYRRSSSLSLLSEFANVVLDEPLKQSLLNKEYGSSSGRSYNGLAIMKPRPSDHGISWRWMRNRKGIRTKKLSNPTGRRSTDGTNMQSVSREKSSFQADNHEEIEQVRSNFHTSLSINSDSQHRRKNRSQAKDQYRSSMSLNTKYRPKRFEEIVGNEIIVKALSNAVQKEKIAPLYLFHGPSGTGKTSTARIFSMALNCESTTDIKPCWNCRGCTRSLYIMDLCSGSRISGFERVKTLLQSTTFSQIVNGFKVFIVEECHSLTVEAWEEILNIVERASASAVIFVMITEDVNMVPKGVSSRCQKFCFPKLKDVDIILKLARIVTREEIGMEREALRLITSKADGSMREAENILEQLALLGSRVTSPMVQQIVGLVPHNKLLDLLTTVLSADTIKTVKTTRELIASGVHPQSILSQLASLITDILSGAAATATTSSLAGSSKDKRLSTSGSQLSADQSDRLSCALKMLVETEKQLGSSSDQTNWVVAGLLQIAPGHTSNRTTNDIVLPRDIIAPTDGIFDNESRGISTCMQGNAMSEILHWSRSRKTQQAIDSILENSDITTSDLSSLVRSISKTKGIRRTTEKEPNLAQMANMKDVWQNILERIQSEYVKEFLGQQAKIASLTISSANAIVHLLFMRPEDKLAAQKSLETIESALKTAFGCPVTVNMSLDPMHVEINERITVSTPKGKETQCYCRQQKESAEFIPPSESPSNQHAGAMMLQNISRKSSAASDNLKTMKLQGDAHTSQDQDPHLPEKQEANTARPQQILPFSGPLTQVNGATSTNPENDQAAIIKKATNIKHRWLSLSSIPQADASVEQYSQDLLFENENNDRERGRNKHLKLYKASVKEKENEDQQFHLSARAM
ncbi:hypothetical protein ACHQM5_015718 [Ranunculus cassubicifolius]